MARKPHNYVHFQNLVDELKEQNEHNFAGLKTHLAIQTDVLQSMRGIMLQGIQQENVNLKKGEGDACTKLANTLSKTLLKGTEIEEEQTGVLSNMLGFFRKKDKIDKREKKEERLEQANKEKFGLTSKSKLNLPRFSGKGFMGMLGNFLSTALIGIPGGLRRFLPRTLGMALIPKLARGVALMVAGPTLIEALQAGFSQKTFSGGVTAFMNSFFAEGGEGYTSLGSAAAGGAGKGALLGFGLLGPRGAIIGGILGGALTGLNNVFGADDGKMDSEGVMTKMKKYLLKNLETVAGVGLGIMGAKFLMPLGLSGMIAGAVLGSAIGFIGSGAIREMMAVEEGGEKNLGVACRTGLKNWYMKIDWGSGGGAAGAGAGVLP